MLEVARGFGRYWGCIALGDLKGARRALGLLTQDFRRGIRDTPEPWRGANLGGWLLLEPGPASPFFSYCTERISAKRAEQGITDKNIVTPEAEHELCVALDVAGGEELKRELLNEHRRCHYDGSTFMRLRECGLNAVRLPFGYWTVTGPTNSDPYHGPCLEVIDRAVELATQHGLQVLLDLHGNPGGENGDRPCGRKDPDWLWWHWRFKEALQVLHLVAERYCSSSCVTGFQVCNEPSLHVPVDQLCRFYERAVETIREAGMGPDRVTVVLPVFNSDRLAEISEHWESRGNSLKYDNVAFDIHYYHNFSFVWNMLSHEQHLQVVTEHARELALLPGAVVGEWSLSRPSSADYPLDEQKEFALRQVAAYNHASHGWFFWNWHDFEELEDWDMERGVFGRGLLPRPWPKEKREGLLFPDWEADRWERVPSETLAGFWPNMLAWMPTLGPLAWSAQSALFHGSPPAEALESLDLGKGETWLQVR